MNVKERIKKFTKEINLSISEFEKSIGVANGYVNSISKGIGRDKIEIILEKYPKLNIEWLLTGKGEMLRTDGQVPEQR
ncbi:MAG: helix-turn-helix domain-containing protein, partial [Dysgonamonadaceae bacterium]|nr:helix-turn-helix domain-containing protein [Dysgonamonadaceae bacterium]